MNTPGPFDGLFLAQRWVAVITVALLFAVVTVFTGCSPIPKAQKGGTASARFPQFMENLGMPAPGVGGAAKNEDLLPGATMTQPENPNGSSEQTTSFERSTETAYATPATTVTETKFPDGRVITVTDTKPPGTIVKDSVKQNVEQKLSGSFMDKAREIGVKLAAARPIQMVGIGLMLFGVAGLFYTPLRLILGGGKQLPIACAAVGLLLLVLMPLIAGNERLVIVGVIVGGFIYWLSIRLTRKETIVDMNNNGIDDRKESPPAT